MMARELSQQYVSYLGWYVLAYLAIFTLRSAGRIWRMNIAVRERFSKKRLQ